MKKRFAIMLLIVMMFGITAMVSGCSAKSAAYDQAINETESVAGSMPETETPQAAPSKDTGIITSPTSGFQPAEVQKVIKTGYAVVETTDFTASYNALMKAVEESGGYVERANESGDSLAAQYAEKSYRYGSYSIRIPKEKYEAFYAEGLQTLGNIIDKSSNIEDVTANYMDLEARIKSLKAQEDRLLEMLAKAEVMEDMIALESKLYEVRYTIESYESTFKSLETSISYSTLQIDLREVDRYSFASPERMGFGDRIVDAFHRSIVFLGDLAQGIVVGTAFLLPILIIPVIILVIVLIIYKKRRKEKNNKIEVQ